MKTPFIHPGLALMFAVFASLCFTTPLARAEVGPKVLIAAGDEFAPDVQAKLMGTGFFSAVDIFDVTVTTPTLAQLLPYAAILVYSNATFANPTALGNVAADYIDAGGGVVEMFGSNYGGNGQAYALVGRFYADNYAPLQLSDTLTTGPSTLVPDLPGHPLLAGVASFDGGSLSFRGLSSLTPGAVQVAHWTDGIPLAAVKSTAGHQVVALNFFPFSSDAPVSGWLASTDGARLMANALLLTITPAEPVTTVLAQKNDAAPDIAGGIYKGFLLPSLSTTTQIIEGFAGGPVNGAPVGGTQVFAGWLGTVKSSAGSHKVIYNGLLGSPHPGVQTGDLATDAGGTLPGVTFGSFKNPVFAGLSSAFIASLKGAVTPANKTGIWTSDGGIPVLVARAGDAAPSSPVGNFKSFTSLSLVAPTTAFFTATLANNGSVTSANNKGLWVAYNGALVLAIQKGLEIAGAGPTVKSFKALTSVSRSPGAGRYETSSETVDVQVSFSDGTSAVGFVDREANFIPLITTGTALPSGIIPKKLGIPSRPSNGAEPVLTMGLENDAALGVTSANNVAVVDNTTGPALGVLARKGDIAPGTGGAAPFKAFKDPVSGMVNSTVVVAIPASVDSGDSANDAGLWVTSSSGLKLLAREGDEPLGAAGTIYKSFPSAAILDERGAMFTAKLASGANTVTSANDDAFFATYSNGGVHLMFREGDTIVGKTLKHFKLLGAVSGSPGQRRAFAVGDPNPEVIWLGTFGDGTTAILTTTIP